MGRRFTGSVRPPIIRSPRKRGNSISSAAPSPGSHFSRPRLYRRRGHSGLRLQEGVPLW